MKNSNWSFSGEGVGFRKFLFAPRTLLLKLCKPKMLTVSCIFMWLKIKFIGQSYVVEMLSTTDFNSCPYKALILIKNIPLRIISSVIFHYKFLLENISIKIKQVWAKYTWSSHVIMVAKVRLPNIIDVFTEIATAFVRISCLQCILF